MATMTLPQTSQIIVTLEDNALVADIKRALKMIRGIASVRTATISDDHTITPAMRRSINKARREIEYSKEADRTLRKWKKSNPQLFKKATKILMDIMQHPRTGLGHPEALVGGNDVTYSRHITAHDRIIYDIYDDRVTVLVVQAEEHYNDK